MFSWLRAALYFHLGEPRLLSAGTQAPPFVAPDQYGHPVHLADFTGRNVLLWFFPKADTPGCTREGCGLRDQMEYFRELNTQVVGISFDSVDANRRFSDRHQLSHPLLSDSSRQAGIAYGACLNRRALMPKRVSYLIDSQGRILYSWGRVDPALHPGQVINTLSANFYRPL